MLVRQFLDLGGIASDEDRVGHEAHAVLQRHASLLADLQDRADEVLVHAHAPGDAVHDDADSFFRHGALSSCIWSQSGIAWLA